ncbi:MAG: tryptophan--tRNA ligase [Candidatus Colwellbacteria bacterium]|nr:tryptophan--tRNA ligase [Candidatus Colwellbacteria bacterium]
MKTVVSGFKPSGILHIGNYLGALRQAVELQENKDYRRFYFIADYHSLTQKYTSKEKTKEIYEMAVDVLAIGIDPKKSTFFMQSHIGEHADLAWIFNTMTSVGELERMVEYKEKVTQGQVPNAGLFTYPVLQAADVLIYKGELVPVGEDQRQHLELARAIARTFNNRFGKTFPEPKAILTKAPRVMSLNNARQKMSKSLPQGCLFLTDKPQIMKEKIMRAETDSYSEIGYDPVRRGAISNLVMIYAELSGLTTSQVVQMFKGVGYAEFKKELAELAIKTFKPFQERRAKLIKNRAYVMRVLEEGAKAAEPVARATMKEVRRKVGLI